MADGGGNPGGLGGADAKSIEAISGLIAVVVGIGAVALLATVTITRLTRPRKTAIGIASSAFGVISAVVGADLGMKITADTSAGSEHAEAQPSRSNESELKEERIWPVNETIDELVSGQLPKVQRLTGASQRSAESEARTNALLEGWIDATCSWPSSSRPRPSRSPFRYR